MWREEGGRLVGKAMKRGGETAIDCSKVRSQVTTRITQCCPFCNYHHRRSTRGSQKEERVKHLTESESTVRVGVGVGVRGVGGYPPTPEPAEGISACVVTKGFLRALASWSPCVDDAGGVPELV